MPLTKTAPAAQAALDGSLYSNMKWIPGGVFWMGSNNHYPEESPQHRVRVDGFWMDYSPVTNADFQKFVEETGYVTFAEIPPNPADYPGALQEMLHPGSVVFVKPRERVDLNVCTWWQFVFGADWRHPLGPDSSLAGLEKHPVVHVTYGDVEAYAKWAGKELPTEGEWEFAARGGLDRAAYAWGDELYKDGHHMANTWQGEFPWQNLRSDGYERTSPVDAFAPNGYGLVDMIGNAWERSSECWRDIVSQSGPRIGSSCSMSDGSRSTLATGFCLHFESAFLVRHT